MTMRWIPRMVAVLALGTAATAQAADLVAQPVGAQTVATRSGVPARGSQPQFLGAPLDIHGLPHTLTANATASYSAPTWTIGNGTPGQPEGVSIDLLGAEGLEIGFQAETGLTTMIDDGRYIETRMVDNSGPTPVVLASLRTEVVGNDVLVTPDFSGLGATSYTLQLRDGDRLVHEEVIPVSAFAAAGGAGKITGGGPGGGGGGGPVTCNGEIVTVCMCELLTKFTFLELCDRYCYDLNGTKWYIDSVWMIPNNPIEGVDEVQVLSNQAMYIDAEAIPVGDAFVGTYEGGPLPTDTLLDASSGNLVATNLDGPTSGITFSFSEAAFDAFTLDAPLVESTSRTLTTYGTLDGVDDHLLFEQSVLKLAGEHVVSIDFSPLGSGTFDLLVSHLGVPVYSASGIPNGEAFKVVDGGEVTYKTEYVWNPPRTTCCLPEVIVYGSAFSVLADMVTLSPSAPTGFVSGGVSHRLVVDGIPSLTLAMPQASPLPTLDEGRGLAGTGGLPPKLVVSGTLVGGTVAGFGLFGAVPSSVAFVVLGVAEIALPFKGGVLVPSPDVILGVPTGPTGTLVFPVAWPNDPGLSGFGIWMQDIMVDPIAPAGFSMSNAVQMITP
ncbi:MAG: hypothetical protein H6825_02105 [Planctomycetes bacterium]|nr:hypothetical protein [Planctomycetota bacterium]